MRRGRSIWLAWILWSLAAGLTAGGMVLLAVTRSMPDTDTTEPWLSGLLRMPPGQLAFPTAGLVVSLRRPASPIGWLMSGVGLVLCANEFMRLYGVFALQTSP